MARTLPTPPDGVALSQLPTIRGKDAACAWINDTLGVPIRKNMIVEAANARTIPCRKIGGALYFSTQGLFEWVTSLGVAA
ncbi:hypothetical protein [Mycobacteroides abscessus]|uniref:hypothetical protein n=1 Tax=Mycobacteroides abscessus TaxID=36809 RepID=UPI000C261356|nr:hypothetical protein [Mycobacteroides abscessus]RIR68157.1 hypothetical protein D2E62_03620 [Mycobacteroides abscessus]